MNNPLDDWLRKSTQASGVPLKVRDRRVIASLQMLVQTARRAQALAARGKQSKT